ncbi:MAG: AmmeMemoRadiSam system radical SAM enzyme [Candidatus Latescibacterota bacterium]
MDASRCSRRAFLQQAARCGALLAAPSVLARWPEAWEALAPGAAPAGALSLEDLIAQAPVARFWVSSAAGGDCAACHIGGQLVAGEPDHGSRFVRCRLCPHECVLAEGQRGRCRARYNHQGELRTLVYGRPITEHLDPIEKKPFYHFLPGSSAYSLATSGCPLRCRFCQNWQISQAAPEEYTVSHCSPEEMVERARDEDAPVIAFTYNEPTVFTEYLLDIAREARQHGIRTVIISCGYTNPEPLAEIIAALDGIKIDLKGFSPDFYRKVSAGELDNVLRSIRQVAAAGKHLELVNLVVPTLNDSEQMLRGLAEWVVGEVGPDVPVHFTRFHPDYQLRNLPPTPVSTLERARQIALDSGIHYAYVGNVPGHPGNHTYCPGCGRIVVERTGFLVTRTAVREGQCAACQTRIAGVW